MYPNSKRELEESDDSFYLNTRIECSKSKRAKVDHSSFKCEYCQRCFANSANLKQHFDSFHSKNSVWTCSECKKPFTSKSNLKVHLRVHTKIKPYHCKSCSYSCMHHSSIKEHLARLHPSVVHSSSNPAYVYNSTAVPEPEQFNSADFNREAFIAEAKQANNKLVEQIYKSNNFNSSVNISPVSNSSVNSSYLDSQQQDSSFNVENSAHSRSISLSQDESVETPLFNESQLSDSKQAAKAKFSNFSISSLLEETNCKQSTTPHVQFPTSVPTTNYFNNSWVYNNQQLQMFYAYLYHLQLNKQN